MSKIFKNLIFFLLILKILSVPGEEGFTTSDKGDYKKVDPLETCPCDTTKTCEKGCCCDKDCLNFMLNNDFFDDNFECDPESSSSRRIESKLEYCEDYKKSIDDLYNPLVLAFKILKRGFCLFRNNNKSKDEENKNSQDEDKQEEKEASLDDYNDENYIKVPIALPSGMCLFNSYPIKQFEQDYEVTCTYKDTLNYSQIIDQNILNLTNNTENFYYFKDKDEEKDLKKLEIFYFSDSDHYEINYYYEKKKDNAYQDFTFVIKNFYDKYDFHKSGNPGYIKGKPILIGEKEENAFRIKKFMNDIVFPVKSDDNTIYKEEDDGLKNKTFYYYDNYMDNKLTFEDLIFFKYEDQAKNLFEIDDNLKPNLYYGKFGNANLKYKSDWEHISFDNKIDDVQFLLLGVYTDFGLVNNTQFKIQDFEMRIRDSQVNNTNYFIMKFLKKNDTETDWWFAPGPGFIIRVPKNWMYPFQVGTTTYKTKS